MSRVTKVESRGARWTRWAALAVTSFLLLLDSLGKVLVLAPMVEGTLRLGYQRHHVFWLGVVEAACTVAFAVPRTSPIGAILLTGFLGGATASHVRLDQAFAFPVLAGVIVWVTLLLRRPDARHLLRVTAGAP
jgi:hypothetical protein